MGTCHGKNVTWTHNSKEKIVYFPQPVTIYMYLFCLLDMAKFNGTVRISTGNALFYCACTVKIRPKIVQSVAIAKIAIPIDKSTLLERW